MEYRCQFIQSIVDEMRREAIGNVAVMQEIGFLDLNNRRTLLRPCDISLNAHLVQHFLHAQKRAMWIEVWVTPNRRTRNTRQHSRLRDIKLRGGGMLGRVL